jgi:hypothetical protein
LTTNCVVLGDVTDVGKLISLAIEHHFQLVALMIVVIFQPIRPFMSRLAKGFCVTVVLTLGTWGTSRRRCLRSHDFLTRVVSDQLEDKRFPSNKMI